MVVCFFFFPTQTADHLPHSRFPIRIFLFMTLFYHIFFHSPQPLFSPFYTQVSMWTSLSFSSGLVFPDLACLILPASSFFWVPLYHRTIDPMSPPGRHLIPCCFHILGPFCPHLTWLVLPGSCWIDQSLTNLRAPLHTPLPEKSEFQTAESSFSSYCRHSFCRFPTVDSWSLGLCHL